MNTIFGEPPGKFAAGVGRRPDPIEEGSSRNLYRRTQIICGARCRHYAGCFGNENAVLKKCSMKRGGEN